DHAGLVAAAGDFDDPLLFSFLESVKAGKLEERSLDTIRQISLVTGRDIAATSWMVAKLILAWREGPIKRASVRYLVPNEDGSEVTSCFVGTESASIIRSRVRNEQLIQLYSEPCDLIAIRAHGSEACANGGNDILVCGLAESLNGPSRDCNGILSCGRGYACPHGTRTVKLAHVAARIAMLGVCNGLRLADSNMTIDFNFPLSFIDGPGIAYVSIVKPEWLKPYAPNEKPERFDQILQSWDHANKDSELADFSVCTTWGLKRQHMFLLDVYRRKVDFPNLKRAVRELAARYNANVVLVEDKASGTSLIQELRAEHFSVVKEAPAIDGDKIMRLHAQTAKIEGGFVLVPKEAPWLETYVLELVTFPNAKYDDQVDSTVFALAWSTLNMSKYGWTKESLEALASLNQELAFARLCGWR